MNRNPFYDLNIDNENVYSEKFLKDIKNTSLIKLNDNFWVLDGMTEWDHLLFLEFQSESDIELNLKPLCKVNGYSDSLREMRHTWFADKGYIFYLNKVNFLSFLDYCSKYFDMD